jgi:hypothetical protein
MIAQKGSRSREKGSKKTCLFMMTFKALPNRIRIRTISRGALLGRLLGKDVASGGGGRLLGEVDSDSTLPGSCRSPPRRWQSGAGRRPRWTQREASLRSKQARAVVAGLTLPGRCSGGRSQAAQWAFARQIECADKEADWFFCG